MHQNEFEKIEILEGKILSEEAHIERDLTVLEKKTASLSSLEKHRRRLVKKLAKHRFLFSMIVSFGVVLVWRGIWDITAELPVLKESAVALITGFVIIWFLEKYSEVE
jgi:hypothetical protein